MWLIEEKLNAAYVNLFVTFLNYVLKMLRAIETNHFVIWSDFIYSVNIVLA